MNLAELSLRRPVTAAMVFVSLVALGLLAARRLPLEQFPDANVPFVMVMLPYPGSTPTEIERTVVRPVEEALSTLPGIAEMNSTSTADEGRIFMMFSDWDRNIEITASEARDRIDAIRDELPDDLQRYRVFKFSPNDQPLLRVRFAGERNMVGEYPLIDREFRTRLERLPGVARVDITGAPPLEVEIALLPARLGSHGVAVNELVARLRSANFSISAGEIDDGSTRMRVQPIGELASLEELRALPINDRGLQLSDIADVHFKNQDVDFGRRIDGRPAVGLDIFRESSANLVEVSKLIHDEIEAIRQEPDFAGIEIKYIHDQAESVQSSIDELLKAGLLGSLLSVFVLFYFLRHVPSTLMVTLAIPLCIAITLGAMYFLGLTLNILTMMGLLLGVGMLVDNAVVVVESIYQQREKYPGDPVRCAVEGTRSVQLAISAGTLSSIIVFAPNMFGETNMISIYLGQVALTITIALLASWLVAVSLIPMISARLKTPKAMIAEHGFVPNLTRVYGRALDWSLKHRGWSFVGILLIVGISIFPATKVKFDMNAEEDGREVELFYDWQGSYSLEQISDEVRRIEDFLDARRDEYQLKQIYSWFSERGWAGTTLTMRDAKPRLIDRLLLREAPPGTLSPGELKEKLREALPKSALAEIGFEGGRGPGGGGDEGVQVQLTGDSMDTLIELADNVVSLLSNLPELRDVRVDTGDDNSEVQVRVDRERAAALGFSATEVAQYVGVAIRGTPLREFRKDQDELPVWLRFANARKIGLDELSTLTLRRADGTDVPLTAVVDIHIARGASQISRRNRATALSIKANLAPGLTTPDAKVALERVLKGTTLPDGYAWNLDGGSFRGNDETGQQMGFNTMIALVLIYILMAALFESLLFPAAIIFSILFSMLGVFWLFWMTGTTFTIMASIGILVLMGVVVNNGIVLFEHVGSLRRAGVPRHEALLTGCRERLRPILMTMATTVLGMLPLCVSTVQIGGGGPSYSPMARAVAGGLVFSTIVSLLFLPTIYAALDDLRLGTGRIIRRAGQRAPRFGTAAKPAKT